jgi:hypothetical protein
LAARIGDSRLSISANGSPSCLWQAPVRLPNERRAAPVGAVVQLLRRDPLGAQETVAEDIVRIAAYGGHLIIVERDRQPGVASPSAPGS